MDDKPGKHYRFEKYEFWAQQGLITLVDTELAGDGSVPTEKHTQHIPPGEFLKRAMSAMIAEPDKYPSKLRRLRKLLEDAAEACKLAKKQGDPSDSRVMEHMRTHRRSSSSRIPAIILPGHPVLPPMPGQRTRIKPKSTVENILGEGISVVPDVIIPTRPITDTA